MYLLISLDFGARQLLLSVLELVTLPVLRQTLETIKTFIYFLWHAYLRYAIKSGFAICAMCCF